MKALVKAHAERGIWMQEVDEPTVGHNDVLIKVSRSAVCGTDIHIFQWDDWARNTITNIVVVHLEHKMVQVKY